jgi:hypothetical protein
MFRVGFNHESVFVFKKVTTTAHTNKRTNTIYGKKILTKGRDTERLILFYGIN